MRLQVNQSLWIQVVGGAENGSSADCVVSMVTNDGVALRFPDLTELPEDLAIGSSVLLRATSEQGVHTAVTRVVDAVTQPRLSVTVWPPKSFSTTQNRRFFRVNVKLPVSCSIRSSALEETVGSSDPRAHTLDISAGGMRLSTGLPLRVGDEVALNVKVRMPRSAETSLDLAGRVLRVARGEQRPKAPPSYVVGVEFIQEKREQDTLVVLMFDLQRRSQR